MTTWLPNASCEMIIAELIAYLQQTKEQEEEDKKFAEFVAKASPAAVASPEGVGGKTPTAGSPVNETACFVGVSTSPIPHRAVGFTPVCDLSVQAVQEAQQTRLFAFALKHGDAAPELESAANAPRDEMSMEMSHLADMMGEMELESPAVSSPLELDEEAQQLTELSELDDMLRAAEEMDDADEEVSAVATRSDRDGVATELELLAEVESAKEARAAALARKSAAAVPAPSIEVPAVDPSLLFSSPRRTADLALATADANLLETPYLQSRSFTQPDVETPGGTFLFASSSPPALRDVTNSRSAPAPSIGRPFEVDFDSNMPTPQLKQPNQHSDDTLYLEEMRGRLKAALKCGVAELGAVIRTLKAAKPLQVEPCISLLYHKLRRHAQALHAARRGNVAIKAHKPSLGQLAVDQTTELSAPFEASPSPRHE
eukprot:COSAG02_NODE_7155_length_3151_cov_3.877130_1_plen_430_part_00